MRQIPNFHTNVTEVEELQKGKLVKSKRYVIQATVMDNDNLEETRLVLNDNESVNRAECACTCSIGRNNF